ITTVRAVDPRHLIFLEGDMFGSRFDGLEGLVLPDAGNVVWSFHDYGRAQMGPGRYPGRFGTRWTDAAAVEEAVHSLPGPRFATRHGIPLWVGEFGASFSGSPEDEDDRLQALDAQIAVFDQAGWSWTAWTLKDMGAMGLITVDPDSAYGRLAAVTAPGRAACRADRWSWRRERPGPVSAAVRGLAVALEEALGPTAHDVARAAGDRVGTGADTRVGVGVDRLVDGIEARVCSDFAADLLQERFVSALAGVIAGDEALEAAASSFSFGECRVRKPYADLLADRLSLPV
ncbi:MAG TPA: cellulase family glycosylhydrolase, partial [Acidimicrobiales bacterium]|nr:cellulase family glycosylhydrolase [Acidimicrobiales bacterium]